MRTVKTSLTPQRHLRVSQVAKQLQRRSQRNLEAREKRARAVELREAGATYEEIARTVGYKTPSGAFAAVMTAIDRLDREPTARAILLELGRLDDYQKRATHALKSSGDVNHINLLLRLMEMRLRLMGATPEVIREIADRYNGVSTPQSGAVSVTNNGHMVVVQGTSQEDFVKKMMAAVGVPEKTQDEYLSRLEKKQRTIKVPSKTLKALGYKKKGGGVGGTPTSTPMQVPTLGESNLPPHTAQDEIEIIDAEIVEEVIDD